MTIMLETGSIHRFSKVGNIHPIVVRYRVNGQATTKIKGKEMSRTAINTQLGPFQRQLNFPGVITMLPKPFSIENLPKQTVWLLM